MSTAITKQISDPGGRDDNKPEVAKDKRNHRRSGNGVHREKGKNTKKK